MDFAPGQLLHSCIGTDDYERSYFRVLFDDKHVRYIVVEPDVVAPDTSYQKTFLPTFPVMPPGDWTTGHIQRNSDGRPDIVVHTTALPGAMNIWHTVRINHLELVKVRDVSENVWEVRLKKAPQKGSLIFKCSPFLFEIKTLQNEMSIYQRIAGYGIGPNFIGHVYERNLEGRRIVGFLMEKIARRPVHATAKDLRACQDALRRLHTLGFKHGDVNRHNFLICDGRAVLIDFETTETCTDRSVLDAEYHSLEQEFADSSGRGAPNMKMEE